jgi:hypothetical protein
MNGYTENSQVSKRNPIPSGTGIVLFDFAHVEDGKKEGRRNLQDQNQEAALEKSKIGRIDSKFLNFRPGVLP